MVFSSLIKQVSLCSFREFLTNLLIAHGSLPCTRTDSTKLVNTPCPPLVHSTVLCNTIDTTSPVELNKLWESTLHTYNCALEAPPWPLHSTDKYGEVTKQNMENIGCFRSSHPSAPPLFCFSSCQEGGWEWQMVSTSIQHKWSNLKQGFGWPISPTV